MAATQVYQATNTANGKVYFGKAANAQARWGSHLWAARHGSPYPFHRALRKHGAETFRLDILAVHPTNEEACRHEIRLISQADPKRCYNVARGGDGGTTMTQAQLDAQYAIGPDSYDEFRKKFGEGATVLELAAYLQVSSNAVTRCAKRLGLAFASRPRQRKTPVKGRSRAKYTAEQRAERRAQANQARGLSENAQAEVLRLYCDEHLTAQEVALRLNVSKGSVRATINRAYSTMSAEERTTMKHRHGSAVRSGARNPNARRP